MAKLRGKAKEEFLKRMAAGRRRAARGNPKKKKNTTKKQQHQRQAGERTKSNVSGPRPAKKKAKRNPSKLRGKGKEEFLKRMAAGRRRAALGNPRKKAPKKNAHRRRNSDDSLEAAERMFERFHGKKPGHVTQYEESFKYPSNFAELGELRELRIYLDEANPDFSFKQFGKCQCVCTPDGSNIYFLGGDQSVDLEALDIASDKDVIELGYCNFIEYFTVKGFHDFEPTRYQHPFGEENGIEPMLAYDRLNKTLFLLGGDYRVKPEGIVN